MHRRLAALSEEDRARIEERTGLPARELDPTGAKQRGRQRDRQSEWRARQAAAGLVQVRAWVPVQDVDRLMEFAAELRAGVATRPVPVPPTPKQLYEARQTAKAWNIPMPEDAVLQDGRTLAMWLTVYDRGPISRCDTTPPGAERIEAAEALARAVGETPPAAVHHDARACGVWIRKISRRLKGK